MSNRLKVTILKSIKQLKNLIIKKDVGILTIHSTYRKTTVNEATK